MGRTSDGLNSADSSREFVINSMAPQKIWVVESMLPCNVESVADSFNDILFDMKDNDLDVEFEEIIGSNVQKGLCDQANNGNHGHSDISEYTNQRSVTDGTKKEGMDDIERHSLLEDMLVGGFHGHGAYSEAELQHDKATLDRFIMNAIVLDHSYARCFDKQLDIYSDSCTLFGKTEDYSDQSAICSNQKLGIDEQVLASCMEFSKHYMGFKPLSPASSTSSLSADLIVSSPDSVCSGDESDMSMGTSSLYNRSFTHSPSILSHKSEGFKTHLKSIKRKHLNHKSSMNNNLITEGIAADSHVTNSSQTDGVLPSPHTSGFYCGRSVTDSEKLNGISDTNDQLITCLHDASTVAERLHSVFHDHDYCAKIPKSVSFDGGLKQFKSYVYDNIGKFKGTKRKYTKRNTICGLNEKILKARYLKKELLKDSSLKLPVLNPKPQIAVSAVTKPNSKTVGRKRKRMFDKSMDEDIDPAIEKKLKITGKFQDQYVYYLSKSSRTSSRGRQTRVSSLTSDKSPVPIPNAGDIVIPHLTDADIEAVRLKGRTALKSLKRPHSTSASPDLVPFQSVNSALDHSVEHMSDVDSHIVSTILSMESDRVPYSTSPQAAPDIITSSLNPNQPALTESLRLMSGDPTITSEHVLNYLLSLVKDDGLAVNEYGSETTPVFFPPLSSADSNTMVDHTEESEAALQEDTNNVQCVSSGEELLHMLDSVESSSSNNQMLHSGVPDHFHSPQSDCVTDASLLDDLSSMLESKEALFPSGNLHLDPNSPVKKRFKHDLSTLETPQVTSSVDKLRSIEKTIDYLHRKDGTFDYTHAESSLGTLPFVDDTPWIVTVTLYFNDVPAVMMNNQPHIRLVDIYKLILPSKDTGILKKRCQLLKIPILSCTEMQRHFLVQYGRACNSKSTVVVSKTHAENLIAYYAAPRPRVGRPGHAQKLMPNRNNIFHKTSRNGKLESKKPKESSTSQSLPVSKDVGTSLCIQQGTFNNQDISLASDGKHKKHRKAKYLNLLKSNKKERSSNSAVKTFESAIKTASSQTCNKQLIKMSEKAKLKHFNKCDGSKRCSHIHKKKKKTRHIHKIDRKHNKKDIYGEMRIKQPTDMFLETNSRVGLPQSMNCQTLKLKVKNPSKKCKHKKRLHHKRDLSSGSSATSTAAGGSLRTLPVRHQAALPNDGAEAQLPPQPADLYLDLFNRPDSACVCCATCSQYLSVSHFMRHHHVPSDSGLLAFEAAQRILVPQNHMNLSKREEHLWQEFQRLRKTIGEDIEVDSEYYESDEYHNHNKLPSPKKSPSSALHKDHLLQYSNKMKRQNSSSLSSPSLCQLDCDTIPDSLWLKQSTLTACIPSVSSAKKHSTETNSDLMTRHNTRMHQHHAESAGTRISSRRSAGLIDTNSARTSTRKRKSKQLFSIENY
ncbi:hypothetical protein BsWGS_04671 [Bradybaena similaris]